MLVGLKKKSCFCLFLFLKNANKKKAGRHFFLVQQNIHFFTIVNILHPTSVGLLCVDQKKMLTTLFYQFFMSVHL